MKNRYFVRAARVVIAAVAAACLFMAVSCSNFYHDLSDGGSTAAVAVQP
jgi:hypothetical protein